MGMRYAKKDYPRLYGTFYAIGINSVVWVDGDDKIEIDLPDIAKQADLSKLEPAQRPLLNPTLQLSGIYFMQELRRPVEKEQHGNIRELENVMERINILADGREVQKEDLPHYISENYHTAVNDEVPSEAVTENGLYDAGLSLGKTSAEEIVTGNDEIMPWEYYEREIIRKALKKYGSYNAAGKALGLTHKTVAAKARKYHIEE